MVWQRDVGKERQWRRHLARWRRSGLTVREYCAAVELAEHNFYAWKRALAERDRQAKRSRPRRQRRRAVPFVPMQVVADEPTSPRLGHIEVVLGNGRVLRLWPGCDLQFVKPVVAALEGPAC